MKACQLLSIDAASKMKTCATMNHICSTCIKAQLCYQLPWQHKGNDEFCKLGNMCSDQLADCAAQCKNLYETLHVSKNLPHAVIGGLLLDCKLLLQAVAEKDVAYERIMSEPTVQLQMLADALDIGDKVVTKNANKHPVYYQHAVFYRW